MQRPLMLPSSGFRSGALRSQVQCVQVHHRHTLWPGHPIPLGWRPHVRNCRNRNHSMPPDLEPGPDAQATQAMQEVKATETMAGPATGPGRWARLQQNLNLAGVSLFLRILGGDQRLAVPHLSLADIQTVDWAALKSAGFKAVVFDKDNTLTRPFEMQVEAKLVESLGRCKHAFGATSIALYSNSAGLQQYDPSGHEAAALEAALGVTVLRHVQKKPAGDAAEVATHFGCEVHELVMVGDRYLTDVVFGNRHGMLTVRPAPLTTQGEPSGVLAARRVEEFFVGRWTQAGVRAPPHPLVPDGALAAFVLNTAK